VAVLGWGKSQGPNDPDPDANCPRSVRAVLDGDRVVEDLAGLDGMEAVADLEVGTRSVTCGLRSTDADPDTDNNENDQGKSAE
jgi:hypothetical protein